jgi:hypothetical protein
VGGTESMGSPFELSLGTLESIGDAVEQCAEADGAGRDGAPQLSAVFCGH